MHQSKKCDNIRMPYLEHQSIFYELRKVYGIEFKTSLLVNTPSNYDKQVEMLNNIEQAQRTFGFLNDFISQNSSKIAYTFNRHLNIVGLLMRKVHADQHIQITNKRNELAVCIYDGTNGTLIKHFDILINCNYNFNLVDFYLDFDYLVIIEKCFKYNIYLFKIEKNEWNLWTHFDRESQYSYDLTCILTKENTVHISELGIYFVALVELFHFWHWKVHVSVVVFEWLCSPFGVQKNVFFWPLKKSRQINCLNKLVFNLCKYSM